MKALTIRQPYASRIVRGEKRVENRSRTTHMRGTVLVHAGAVLHDHFTAVRSVYDDLPLAAIVGAVDIVDSHPAASCRLQSCHMGGGFHPGTEDALGNQIPDGPLFHWVLTNPVEFNAPVAATGALGFWVPPYGVRDRVAEQVRAVR